MTYHPSPSTNGLLYLSIERSLEPARILDLCCNTGWLGISLKSQYPQAEVWVSDIVDDNFTNDRSVLWNKGDLFQGLEGKFDLIICNPPYLTEEEWEQAGSPEPKVAYTDGGKGMSTIGRIVDEYQKFLNNEGILVIEFNPLRSEWVKALGGELYRNKWGEYNYAVFRP